MTAAEWDFPHELVERVESPARDPLRSGLLPRAEPVVVAGGARDWPAVRSWNPQSLAAMIGDTAVPVEVSHDGRMPADLARNESTRMPARDFLERATAGASGAAVSLSQASIPDLFPSLIGDLPLADWVPREFAPQLHLDVDSANCRRQLHYDGSHGVVAQCHGRRHVLLFAPEDSHRLYRYPLRRRHARFSQVNVIDPDFARFPRFEDAMPVCCTLEAGDLLFLPAYWWRQWHSPQTSIAVGLWWKADWKAHLHYRQFHWQLASSAWRALTGGRAGSS